MPPRRRPVGLTFERGAALLMMAVTGGLALLGRVQADPRGGEDAWILLSRSRPGARFWTEVDQYQPYFDQWRQRWEYRSRLTKQKK